jgi:glycosyltransferase involved in cell wall biosynthesis
VTAEQEKVTAFAAFLAERFETEVAPISPSGSEVAPKGAVALCLDVPRPRLRAGALAARLAQAIEPAAAAVVAAAPDRWNLDELGRHVGGASGRPTFAGYAASSPLLCVDADGAEEPVPDGFRVLALIPAYNDEDVIVQVVSKLRGQGVEVRVFDNWSTDTTVERLGVFADDDGVSLERFPPEGPSRYNESYEVLEVFERVNDETDADWLIFQSSDEVLRPPWPAVSLRDALWHVQLRGFSAVDHTVLDFRPVDDAPFDGEDPERHFRFFEFPGRPASFLQVRTWKRRPSVSIADSAGHNVTFDGRRVFPYKFLLKHYSFRSAEHGRRKVLEERIPRRSPGDKVRGWNYHYHLFATRERFVWDREELIEFDEEAFARDFLIERLSGVGIAREDAA